MAMKNVHRISALVIISCSIASTALPTISFGSRDSGFVVSSGTLALGSATLADGAVRDVGGVITGTINSTNMAFETRDGASIKHMITDGTVILGSSITLGNNQKLLVNGGTVGEDVAISGSSEYPSIIEGFGAFNDTIVVGSEKQLNMRWSGQLNQHVQLNAQSTTPTTLRLEQDLTFTSLRTIIGTENLDHPAIIDCNGYRLTMGGSGDDWLGIEQSFNVDQLHLELTGSMTIYNSSRVMLTSAGYINGNGNTLSVSSDSSLVPFDVAVGIGLTLHDIVLLDVYGEVLGAFDFINGKNCTFENSVHSLVLDGTVFEGSDFLGGNALFGLGTPIVTLNKDFTPAGVWAIGDGILAINGRGNVLNVSGEDRKFQILTDGALRFENITLAEVSAQTIGAAEAQTVYLSNVNWLDATRGSIHVMGTDQVASSQGAAELTLQALESAGNIFESAVTWTSGVNMALLSDVMLFESTWTFAENSVIDGQGRHLDLASGVLKIATGKTVTLRNIVLDNVSSNSLFDDEGYTGSLNLSNVTIITGGANVTWTNTIQVDGPLTVVTGNDRFTGTNMTLNGVTAFYDTLGSDDTSNLEFDGGTGRALWVGASSGVETTGTITISDDAELSRNEYLYPHDGVAGRMITVTDNATYDGHGRSLVFPYTDGFSESRVVISVSENKTLITKKMILDGLVPAQHIDLAADSALCFGDDTTIRLRQNIVLESALTFGSSLSAHSEQMVLDLQGHTIDMNHVDAAIVLQGQADGGTANTLRIKNGRLINLSSSKVSGAFQTKIILENIELSLSDDTVFEFVALTIEGLCAITGIAGKRLAYVIRSEIALTIASNASLLINDGMIYSHINTAIGSTSLFFADTSSRLILCGGVFRHDDASSAPLLLDGGTLIIDHKSYVQPGSLGMGIATSMNVEVRPGALCIVNAHSSALAGTLAYGA